jgi:hypothetical protein
MKNALQQVGAVVAGIVVAMALFMAGEGFAAAVHPFPDGFDTTSSEQVNRYVMSYPDWLLAVVVPMWGLIGFAGPWTGWKLGNRGSGLAVGAIWVVMVVCNVLSFPYPTWFKVAVPIAAAAGVYGAYLLMRPKAVEAVTC